MYRPRRREIYKQFSISIIWGEIKGYLLKILQENRPHFRKSFPRSGAGGKQRGGGGNQTKKCVLRGQVAEEGGCSSVCVCQRAEKREGKNETPHSTQSAEICPHCTSGKIFGILQAGRVYMKRKKLLMRSILFLSYPYKFLFSGN